MITIRACHLEDLEAVVDILMNKRRLYAELEPALWTVSHGAEQWTEAHFATLLALPDQLFLVAEGSGKVMGFLVASPKSSPPVYAREPTAAIEDFYVADASDWPDVGGALLSEARANLKKRGIAQFVLVSAFLDEAKMAFLASQGLPIVSASITSMVDL
jgi:GNAT superfamily N-acetyltransferase